MEKDIIPIDCDLIREMKAKRNYGGANKLLQAHYNDISKTKRNVKRDINRMDRKTLLHFKVCPQCKKNQIQENKSNCQSCLDKKNTKRKLERILTKKRKIRGER